MAVASRLWQTGCRCLVGAQLTIDTSRDGTARGAAVNRNGVAIRAAHRRKERTYPELVGEGGRARLVTLAGEVDGRWSL